MSKVAFSETPILVLEDSQDDAWLLTRALRKLGSMASITVAADGQEGVDYLTGVGKFADRERYPLPGLIITDLKMPRLDGLGFIKWLRQDPAFKELPAVVLTAST